MTYDGDVEHKSSKVALIRLVIIVVGVLFAVMASGLPMDRLTVILGALGVGIGLGMQNIVNNFVSGIILIFEKPFRIGDYVELADKKGKVKDIGIRSSKLLTPQGSEVIIPNGDFLSGRLVNWTLSHDYVKSELIFKVSSETDLEALNKLIAEEVKQTTHVMDGLPVEILLNGIAAGSVELKVMAWVQSIYAEPAFKSELLSRLMKRLNEAEIKLV
jgi:potassium efflux system protein